MPQLNALATKSPMMTPGGGSTGAPLQATTLHMGQMPMSGVTPTYQMPGQMTPGGGGTGAPLQGTVGMVPGVPGSMGLNPHQANPWQQAKMDWRSQRPDFAPGMDMQAYHQSIMDWRQARPDHQNFLPNGQMDFGNAGIVPPQMLPPIAPDPQNALAPVSQMPIAPVSNPVQGMVNSGNPYQLPTY